MASKSKQKRTTDDLRELLFGTIEDLRSNKIDSKRAKTIADLAGRVIESAALEIAVAKQYADMDKKDLGISIGPYPLTLPGADDV